VAETRNSNRRWKTLLHIIFSGGNFGGRKQAGLHVSALRIAQQQDKGGKKVAYIRPYDPKKGSQGGKGATRPHFNRIRITSGRLPRRAAAEARRCGKAEGLVCFKLPHPKWSH